MFGLFNKRKSKDDLKERLKLVLSYDRAQLTPGTMEQLKNELIEVIAKYFPEENVKSDYDVKFEQQGDRMVLIANLPVEA
jgi:cell division topological specificity factor